MFQGVSYLNFRGLIEPQEAIFLDLLRVIRHHRARLATPIRTVQKVFTDADLDNVPFSDSIFSRGATSNRPLMLIEPSYKINGEDKTKTQARSSRPNGEEDSKATTKPVPDNKLDAKGETTLTPDSKSKATSSPDLKTKETQSDSETKEDHKIASKSTSDSKVNSSTKTALKADNKPVEETSLTAARQPVAQTPVSKPSLEENIVLGVALEGSKRTLPIEEEIVGPSNPEDVKELAKMRSGNGPAVAEKEKNDVKRSSGPGSPSNDQSDQQD